METERGYRLMGLFERIAGALGGPQQVERIANRQANFDDPNSRDYQHWNELVGAAPPEYIQDSVTHAARQVDPREYYEHVTPGVRGTDPLGGVGQGGLAALAGSLLGNLGLGGRQAQQVIPGLRTTDPNRMSPQEVAALAQYMQQHHPEAFGRAAAQVGQQDPGLLQQLLGNKALMLAAAGLAAKYLASRR